MEKNTEARITFATTEKTKTDFIAKAQGLKLNLSEFINFCLNDYERVKSELEELKAAKELPEALPNQPIPSPEVPESQTYSITPLSALEGNEKLDLIIEMITDRLTPMAIDEVEKQTIINAARVEFTKEFEANNLVIPTDATVLAGIEFRMLFNKVLDFNIQKGTCTTAMDLILELIFQTDYFGTLKMPDGTSRDTKAIRKIIKDAEEAAKPQTEEII